MNGDPDQVFADGTLRGDERERLLVDALEEYRTAQAAGRKLNREELLERYSDVGKELADCLDGFDLVQGVAEQVESPNVTPSVSPPKTLGDFSIVRELGRGGMGVVYEAEQISLGRNVALKVLPFAAMLDEKQLRRFKNEAKAAATLNHPNIVPVHFVGTERSVHFYAMQLIEGHNLAEIIEATKQEVAPANEDQPANDFNASTRSIAALSTQYSKDPRKYFKKVAEIGCQTAMALSHAHQCGIIHRDVKPANILVDGAGKPWVTDFGLARADADASMTMSDDIVGTLRYMSPEQASGERHLVDDRADVYSLGATLYELATLRPIFAAANREKLLKQILTEPAQPPRRMNASVPLELETILLKAVAKEPDERYSSAKEFADDLTRFLNHEPIRARRTTLLARGSKWVRRHPGLVLSSVVLLSLGLLASFAASYYVNAERTQTAAALQQSEENFDMALAAVDQMYMQLATRWIADDRTPTAMQGEFLARALNFYQAVVQRGSGSMDKSRLAVVHSRIGQAEYFLKNYREADESLLRAIELARQTSEDSIAPHPELAKYYRLRAAALLERANLNAAETACSDGITHIETLLQNQQLSPEDDLEHLRLQSMKCDLALYRGEVEDVGTLAEDLVTRIRERLKERSGNDQDLRFLEAKTRYLWARSSLARSDFSQALSQADASLDVLRGTFGLGGEINDERRVARLEGQACDLLGEIAEAREDLAAAAERYRESLEVQRKNLRSGKSPASTMIAGIGGNRNAINEWDHFCSYTETQLRLARVLLRLNRPYEAERHLGQCCLVGFVVRGSRYGVLRYQVTEVNAWAQASQAIRDRRPKEAAQLRAHALQIWQTLLYENPQSADFRSGVHGPATDLGWFRSLLDEPELTELDRKDVVAVNTGPTELPKDSALLRNTRARAWYDENGDTQRWVESLTESAELLEADHAYTWLQLAAAHAKLGDASTARDYLSKAEKDLGDTNTPHPELVELRDKARKAIEDAVGKQKRRL